MPAKRSSRVASRGILLGGFGVLPCCLNVEGGDESPSNHGQAPARQGCRHCSFLRKRGHAPTAVTAGEAERYRSPPPGLIAAAQPPRRRGLQPAGLSRVSVLGGNLRRP